MPVADSEEEIHQTTSVQLTFATLPSFYLPSRALFVSSVLHELVIFLLIFLATHNFAASIRRHDVFRAQARRDLVYLPVLGGGHEGSGQRGGGSGVPWRTSAQLPARSSRGFSYPGKQPIFSNPSDPLNFNQTLMHSDLKNLPILRKFTPLPNLVQSSNTAPPLEVKKNNTSRPLHFSPVVPPKVELSSRAPEVATNTPILPMLRPAPPPDLPSPLQRSEAVSRLSTPVAAPAPAISQLPTRGSGSHNIVALSPAPIAEPAPKIPLAETRGRFAVSPEANTASATPLPGSKSSGPEGSGIGNTASAPLGNAAAEVAAGAGKNRSGESSGGGGNGKGVGTGDAEGAGNGGSGNGMGRGTGTGSALGTGAGTTTGSGTGSGSGHGGGDFPGITIQGGRLEGGTNTGKSHGATPVPAQTSYGMTIVSTASSGGGLPDYGVFSKEKVFTVYLDARKTTDDPSIAWTLQYAPIQSPDDPPNTNQDRRALQGLTPPYAVIKEIPKWPPELINRYSDRVIVVSGVINIQGKLEQMLIVQSPDDRLTESITEALEKWVFRPAQMGDHPTAIKVMLGIPLSQ
jgi:hypothetical protein